MVLAVMVVFLCFRVYQVVQPSPPPTGTKNFRPPRSELPPDVETPGTPPRMPINPNPGNWASLWVNDPFFYERPGVSTRRNGDSGPGLDLEVVGFQEVITGEWKVRIRSGTDRHWYSEGDAFQAYELLSIDPDLKCVVVFAEELGHSIEICENE